MRYPSRTPPFKKDVLINLEKKERAYGKNLQKSGFGGLAVVAVACAFVAAAIAFCFLRLKRKDTGSNSSEAAPEETDG